MCRCSECCKALQRQCQSCLPLLLLPRTQLLASALSNLMLYNSTIPIFYPFPDLLLPGCRSHPLQDAPMSSVLFSSSSPQGRC